MTGKQIIEKTIGMKIPENYDVAPHEFDTVINRRQMIEMLVWLCKEVDRLQEQNQQLIEMYGRSTKTSKSL